MKKKQTIWSKIKTLFISIGLTVGAMVIIGATQIDPLPQFQEIVTGQVDADTVQLAEVQGQPLNSETVPPFFAILQTEGIDDDNNLFNFLKHNERDKSGNRTQENSGRRR